ncbi:hypothetical protein [Pseudonocardia acaciae]|uniref:hypothetical protein n=1 Tax=Pseudonocardia acaciae TaxID=551276 RepID=UPI00055F23C3|nr:hypothetical protein [Pseudonocardia acaciae]
MSEEYDLDAIVAQRREAVGGDDIVFTWKGEKFSFPHPLLADDEWKQRIAEADPDDVSQVEAMLGEQYERFHELGGQAGYVMLIVQQVSQKLRDEMSDGRPTRRPTSSGRRQRR